MITLIIECENQQEFVSEKKIVRDTYDNTNATHKFSTHLLIYITKLTRSEEKIFSHNNLSHSHNMWSSSIYVYDLNETTRDTMQLLYNWVAVQRRPSTTQFDSLLYGIFYELCVPDKPRVHRNVWFTSNVWYLFSIQFSI